MPRNYTLDPAHRDERRRKVEYLKIRGLSVRQIAKTLAEIGFVNPATGEPYSVEPIHRDIQWLRGRWAKRHEKERDALVAAQLAEICECKRVAWSKDDLTEVRHLLKREAELLGLDAPKGQRFAGPKGGPMQLENATAKTEVVQIREIDKHLAELEAERRVIEAERRELEREIAELGEEVASHSSLPKTYSSSS